MKLSNEAEKEMLELARSGDFRRDTELLRRRWKTPFIKEGRVDIDGYIEFVTQFNEFISHRPKPLKLIIDSDMKL